MPKFASSTQMTIAPRGMSWHGDKLQSDALGELVRPTSELSEKQIAEVRGLEAAAEWLKNPTLMKPARYVGRSR